MRRKIENLGFSISEKPIHVGGKATKMYVATSKFYKFEARTLTILYNLCKNA